MPDLTLALPAEVGPPPITRRAEVLVLGPELAGADAVRQVLQQHLPRLEFVDHLTDGAAPSAVVFVVSAATPMTESDCRMLDIAAAHTDVVFGVVAKIDAHGDWRRVLDRDRSRLAAYAPRYDTTAWVAVAAAPPFGKPRCDDLVQMMQLLPPESRRNQLRAWVTHLSEVLAHHRSDLERAQARVRELQASRAELVRPGRATPEQAVLRNGIHQLRNELFYLASTACVDVRAELHAALAEVSRSSLSAFVDHVARRADDLVDTMDQRVAAEVAAIAERVGVPPPGLTALVRPPVSAPPFRSGRLEARLTTLVGAGFGMGVALTLGRLVSDIASGPATLVCGSVGTLVAVWVVRTRRLLHDRAVLDRWIGEVVAAARAAVVQNGATAVLAAETALTAMLVRVAEIDSALRAAEAAEVAARAECARVTPVVRAALYRVDTELTALRATDQ